MSWRIAACAFLIGQFVIASSAVAQEDRFPTVIEGGNMGLNAEIVVEDENGERVFVNLSMQEWLNLRRQQGRAFQFKSVRVQASVSENFADVTGNFAVELSARSAEIPLNFGTCQLGSNRPEIQSAGTRSQFLADESGYNWILLAEDDMPPGAEHTISLTGKSVVSRNSGRRQLRISLPKFPCTVQVEIPPGSSDIRLRPEDLLVEQVESDGVLKLTVSSLGGEFNLSFRSADQVNQFGGVEAQSKTSFEIGAPQDAWEATTNLSLRWYGNESQEECRIRLPPGSRWISFPQSDFERFDIARVASEGDSSGALELLIRNPDPSQTQSIDLTLNWEWLPTQNTTAPEAENQVSVPQVMGVSSHRGTVDCLFPSSFSAEFTEGDGIQFIQQRRQVDAFGQRLQRAQFGFSQQDFGLQFSLQSLQNVPTVRPTYLVQVDKDKLVLTGWLQCHFDVVPQVQLGLALGDWKIRDNEALLLAPGAAPFSEEGDILRVLPQDQSIYTVTPANPNLQRVENESGLDQVWRFVAEKSWSPDQDGSLQFSIPEIIRGRARTTPLRDHCSGTLVITSASNLALRSKSMETLLTDTVSEEHVELVQPGARGPLVFRFRGQGEVPVWSGTVDFLPQECAVEEFVEVNLGAQLASLTQRFQVRVANIPITQTRIAVRTDASTPAPQFFFDGLLTSARLVQSNVPLSEVLPSAQEVDAESPAIGWNLYELVGVNELVGKHLISVVSSKTARPIAASTEQGFSGATGDFDLPLAQLVLPENTRYLSRKVLVDSQLRASIRTGSTTIGDAALNLPPQLTSLLLNITPQEKLSRPDAVTLGDSWLQTAITGSSRQDRYVAQIRTSGKELRLRLPDRADVRPPPRFLINGARHTNVSYDQTDDVFIVPLADAGQPTDGPNSLVPDSTETILEVFYTVRSSFSSWNTVEVDVPEIEDAISTGRFYWQLATPRTVHLTSAPPVLTPEWQWQWATLWWARTSALDERGLIRKLGAVDYPILPISTNDYLLSGSSPERPFEVLLVSRFLLWLPIGSLAILLAALVVNIRFLRHPLFAFLIVAALATTGMFYPDLGVLLGQTSVVSLGLVGLTFMTQAAIDSRLRRRSVFSTRPSTYMEGSDQFSLGRVPTAEQIAISQTSSVVSKSEE